MAQRIDATRLRDVIDLAVAAGRVTSDAHLASLSGISHSALSNMLSGRRDGGAGVHMRLAATLKVHVRTITTADPLGESEADRRAHEALAKRQRRARKVAA